MMTPDAVPAVYSVAEVDKHLVEWDRRTIQIRGWVLICGEGRGKGPAITEVKRCDRGAVLPFSFGEGATGPKKLFGRQAIIRTRVDATCRKPNYGCFDHGDLLTVESVSPLSSAPSDREPK